MNKFYPKCKEKLYISAQLTMLNVKIHLSKVRAILEVQHLLTFCELFKFIICLQTTHLDFLSLDHNLPS